MKTWMTRKTSMMLVFVMTATLMFPVLAYASAVLTGLGYNSSNDTISGRVEITDDVYVAAGSPNQITLEVYGPNGSITSVFATYQANVSGGTPGHYYYDLPSTSASGYGSSFQLRFADPSVTEGVYVETSWFTRSSGNGNGNGSGSIVTPPSNTPTKVEFKDGQASVEMKDGKATIDASSLKGASKDSKITFTSDKGSYSLPVSEIDLDSLSKELGTDVSDLKVNVQIKEVSGDDKKNIEDKVGSTGSKLVAPVIDFTVTVEGKDGKSVTISKFGQYVERSITLSQDVNTSRATGVLYDPATGTFSFVPATFSTVGGKTIATLKRNGNSMYTVIESNVSFSDLAGHWAKSDVETLANKLIATGTNGKFGPDTNITRAEFATMIASALALKSSDKAAGFKDVAATASYANAVNAAFEAGIVQGSNGSFKPNDTITRKELAAMLVRAFNYTGNSVSISTADADNAVKAFKDNGQLGWAKADVAALVKTGIIKGSYGKINGDGTATRAEAATMVKRFLTQVKFI